MKKRNITIKNTVYNQQTREVTTEPLTLNEGDIIEGEVHDDSLVGGYAIRGKLELKWYVGSTPLEDIKLIKVI